MYKNWACQCFPLLMHCGLIASAVSTALVVLLLVGLVIFMSSVVKLMMGVNADDTAAFDLLTGMQ